MRSDALEIAVLVTIAYTNQFDFPLTKEEIFQRLLLQGINWNYQHSLSQNKVDQTLKKMTSSGLLQLDKGYFFLSGRNKLSAARMQKHQFSQKKWAEIKKLTFLSTYIPWIDGLFVTGSLAVNSAGKHDDIDVLVITKPRRIWLSRLILVLLSSVVGKRRPWNADVKGLKAVEDSWCFNVWLDRNNLKTALSGQSVYVAYELLQAEKIIDRNHVWHQWLFENKWVSKLVPHFYQTRVNQASLSIETSFWQKVLGFLDLILDWPLSLLDWLMFKLQWMYMKPHMTTERVSWGTAFFHPRNTKGLIYQKWNYSLVSLFTRSARAKKKKVVLVTGVFDLLHQEHRLFLKKARQAGDVLVVGVESDLRVKKMKGNDRPVHSQQKRISQLLALDSVDVAFGLPEQFSRPADHQRLISELQPNVLAVSSHTAHLDKKETILRKYGGQVKIVHQHNPNVSTTAILESLLKKRGGT